MVLSPFWAFLLDSCERNCYNATWNGGTKRGWKFTIDNLIGRLCRKNNMGGYLL